MSEKLSTMEFTVHANFSGSNSSVSRATKKVRTRSDLSLESKDLTVIGMRKGFKALNYPRCRTNLRYWEPHRILHRICSWKKTFHL
ncbi:hypothetical protein J1N35_043602 [Gossypium stocksii]|uniref:Uncharacterized protein n=1 Tax=Gossypium stocksii TaxID=47602 RepID=A0A9D3U7S2_9ROSI|nr:hypothetical protein J1N35_043602 [Gossypium stocksii]